MEGDGFRLDGKVAMVTGAGQGIGKALALGLAHAGASVAVTDRPDNASAADAVQREIQGKGGIARAYALDVRDLPDIRKIVDQVVAEMGRLDIMVNNAGVQVRSPSVEVTEEEWDRTMDVNLKGVFFCAQAAARSCRLLPSPRQWPTCGARALAARSKNHRRSAGLRPDA